MSACAHFRPRRLSTQCGFFGTPLGPGPATATISAAFFRSAGTSAAAPGPRVRSHGRLHKFFFPVTGFPDCTAAVIQTERAADVLGYCHESRAAEMEQAN